MGTHTVWMNHSGCASAGFRPPTHPPFLSDIYLFEHTSLATDTSFDINQQTPTDPLTYRLDEPLGMRLRRVETERATRVVADHLEAAQHLPRRQVLCARVYEYVEILGLQIESANDTDCEGISHHNTVCVQTNLHLREKKNCTQCMTIHITHAANHPNTNRPHSYFSHLNDKYLGP
jgi:hypothetical protein